MILEDITHLQNALENADIDYLDSLLEPSRRVLNKKQNFHAPLMLSAQNIKHLNKIDELSSDSVMLNLEDGVSELLKPFALRLCAYFLSQIPQSPKKLIVRVNPLDEGGEEEIEFLNAYMPDAIRVAKIQNSDDVKRALELIDEDIEVHLSIESASAWLNLKELALHKRVKVFYLGILDLSVELNLPQSLITPTNPMLGYILSHFLVTCRALHVKPVSFVYQDYKNIEEFKKYVELERSMGYDAKGCISPLQAEVMMSYFKDDEKSLTRAKEIVELFEQNLSFGVSGFTHELYGFIDEPIYKDALNRLKNADS